MEESDVLDALCSSRHASATSEYARFIRNVFAFFAREIQARAEKRGRKIHYVSPIEKQLSRRAFIKRVYLARESRA